MKGTFFQKPLEFRLEVQGETWRQGEPIEGVLTVRNHGNAAVSLAGMGAHLARGELKKVHQKSPAAFKLTSAVSETDEGRQVAPGAEATIPWKFTTDRNFPITDSWASPFLLYGAGEAADKLGQLQLTFVVDPIVEEFVKTLEVSYRFVRKGWRSTKGQVELKMDPPSGKAFASVELLQLGFRFEGHTLEIRYIVTVKKLKATPSAATTDVTKQKNEVEQSFSPEQYLTPSRRVNHEVFEAGMREALGPFE